MDIVQQYMDKVRGKGLSVVLPEGSDERIPAAARRLKDDGIAEPVILGDPDKIAAAAQAAGVSIDDIRQINPKQSDKLDEYLAAYLKGRDDISEVVARRMVAKPLIFGGMMLSSGDVDAFVGGAASATASIIQAGVLTVGMAEGIRRVSGFFLMILPEFMGKKNVPFIYADCAVNIQPTAEQLADIALASAASTRKLLGIEPKVAMLSFSTKGSAKHEDIDKVVNALNIVKERDPNLAIDGEFQLDAAISPRVAAKKVKTDSAVAGQANVLIFPDLDAGNIAYKLTQYMAGAKAIGPFLQGFAKPLSDLSRGATVDDIMATSAITLAQI